MKAAQLQAPNEFAIVDLPSRPLGRGEVRVRVASTGICGSDMGIIRGLNPFARYPVVPGHEFSGTLAEVGEGSRFKVGQRVYVKPMPTCGQCKACLAGEFNHCPDLKVLGVHMDGSYAEEVVVAEDLVRPLPDGMSFDEGAMIEPAAIGVHTVNRSLLKPGETVAVLGAGVIGLMVAQVAKARGAGAVFASDVLDSRLELARELGVDAVANAEKQDVVKAGLESVGPFDAVVDLAGPRHTLDQAIALARAGGRIVLLVPPEDPKLVVDDFTSVFRKELTLRVSRLYDKDFDDAAPLIAAGKIRVMPLVTHRFPLDRVREAVDVVANRRENAVKVMLHC